MPIPLISKIKPQNSGAFPMYDDVDVFGGFQVRDDTTDRDSIPTLNRKEGMLVYTIADTTYWILGPGLTNSDWSSANFGGGSDPTALAQTTWYFDSVSGSDTNTGLIGSPLQTTAEYIKRVGFTRTVAPSQQIDLYFLNDMVSTDRLSMKVIMGDASSHFRIHGTLTPILSGSLTNYTALVPSTNTQASITATGLDSTLIGKVIHFPDIDGYSIIWKDLGGGQVYIDEPKIYTLVAYSDMSVASPSNTENFVVYATTKLYLGSIDFSSGYANTAVNAWPAKFMVENFNSVDSFTLNGAGGFYQFTLVRNAQIKDVLTLGNSSNYFRTCYFNAGFGGSTTFSANIETGVKFTGCVFAGGNILMVAPLFGLKRIDSNVINCAFISIEYTAAQEGKLGIFTTNPGAFSGIIVLQGIYISSHDTDTIYGAATGNNVIIVSRDSQFIYQPGFHIYTTSASGTQIAVRGSASPPNLSPSIMLSDTALLPTLAPCTTWAELLATPFNGTAWDYSTQSGFTTDPFNTTTPAGAPPTASAMGGDLDGYFPDPIVVGIQTRPISSTAPADGYALIWDGYAWTPSSNFLAQNISTTGTLLSGPATTTTLTTALEILNGKLIINGIPTVSTLSDVSQGIIYFDSTLNRFRASENGNAYVDLIGGGSSGPPTTDVNTQAPPYTVQSSDQLVAVSSGGTITLEASPSTGRTISIKDINGVAASSNITIDGNGNNIDGSSTYVISVNYSSITLVFTGSSWGAI